MPVVLTCTATPAALSSWTVSERGTPAPSPASPVGSPAFAMSPSWSLRQSPGIHSPAPSLFSVLQSKSSDFAWQSPGLIYQSISVPVIHPDSSQLYIPENKLRSSPNSHESTNALIASGAVVDAVEKRKWTPLHSASLNGHKDAIVALINAGAVVDAREEGQPTPLYFASQNGHVDSINALIASGAAVDAVGKRKWTPLHSASLNGHKDAIMALINAGAVVDAREEGQCTLCIWHRKTGTLTQLMP